MAIDKQALIDAVLRWTRHGGRLTFMPESSGWYRCRRVRASRRSSSTPRARPLCSSGAGFTADNPATIHFWYPTEVTRPYMPDPAGLHEAVTQMLEDAGFVVEPHSDIWDDPGYLFDAQNGLLRPALPRLDR